MVGANARTRPRPAWEHRYYKRVSRTAHTRCWGWALAIGLLLPAASLAQQPAGQIVPALPTTTLSPPPPATSTAPGATGAAAPAKPAPPPYTVLWKDTAIGGDLSLHVVATPTVVVTGGSTTPLQARRRESGEVLWTSEAAGWRSLAEADGLVLAVGPHDIEAVDAATGAARWTRALEAGSARLVVDRGWLFLTNARTLMACRVIDGSVVWQIDLGAEIVTAPALGAAVVVAGLASAELAAVDLKTGTLVWRAPAAAPPDTLAVTDSRVFAGFARGMACAHHLTDGGQAWCFDFQIPLVGAPVADAKNVALALYDNTLRTLSSGSGALIRRDRLGARPAEGLIKAGPSLVVPLATGELAVFDAAGKALTTVPTVDPTITAILEHVSMSRDTETIATLSISPGGRQTLAVYKKAPPPPPPSPTAPAKTGGTASGTPTGSPATAPRTAAPAAPTAPAATGR